MTSPAVTALSELEVELDKILLDPNNPRLLGLEDDDNYQGVEEARIAEAGVQAATLARLIEGPFDIGALKASIQASGLLLVDRIVVRPVPEGSYVVVEGNRRIAAAKTLLKQQAAGEVTLSEAVLKTIVAPKVLLLDQSDAKVARLNQWVIQGIRHISGIRPWGAYQAAKTIEAMVEGLGYSEDQVVSALSIQKSRVRRSLKVLASLEQMAESDDFGDSSGADLYGYFDEVVKRPKVRSWLGWNDGSMKFENIDNLDMFYSWIVPDEELNNERRLPASSSVRSLDNVIDDGVALAVLNTPGRTIQDALTALSPGLEAEWREPVRRAQKALDALPANVLVDLKEEDENLITGLAEVANSRLQMAKLLAAQTAPQ